MAEPGAPARRTWRGWTRGEGFIVVAGLLLIADLVLLPWHHYALHVDVGNLGIKLPSFSYDRSGVQSPNALFGILGLLIAAVMVVQVLASKAGSNPAVARLGQVHLVAGPAVLGLMISKFFSDDAFLGTGAWLGLLLGAGLALGGYLRSQETAAFSGTVGSAGNR